MVSFCKTLFFNAKLLFNSGTTEIDLESYGNICIDVAVQCSKA